MPLECKDICFITAKEKRDYFYDAIVEYGFHVMIPYKDYNLFLRVLREIWFRLRLPKREIWFNPKLKDIREKYIIVKDPLICSELLAFIRKYNPSARFVVKYDNRVQNTFPASEASKYADELWSYDMDDCRQYGMRFTPENYLDIYRIKPGERKEKPEYDIVYVGRDKGRAEYLFELKHKFEEMGLKTYFHITADRSFQRFKRKFYRPVIPYREYVDLLRNTKALLNIMPESQTSITPRDMEVLFDGVKGITNNKGVKSLKFYDKDRYFIIGEDRPEDLKAFLERPFPAVEESELEKLGFDKMVLGMFDSE